MIKKYFDLKLLAISLLSALIYSFGIANFSIPAKLYPSGFSGISRISSDLLHDFCGVDISYSIIYFTLNIVVVFFVYHRLGKKFTIYSTIQFIFVAILTNYFKQIIFINEEILMAIFGGIINGTAIGLALAFNFSTAGFDFVSIFFATKYKKDVWNYIFFVNMTILMIAGLVYGWDRCLYSIIFQFASTQVIKNFHKRYTHKTLTIITKKPDEVSNAILSNVRHGITEIHATGFYSKQDTTILYSIVNSFQYKEVVKIVLESDPHAFINVQNTQAIYGNYYQKPLD